MVILAILKRSMRDPSRVLTMTTARPAMAVVESFCRPTPTPAAAREGASLRPSPTCLCVSPWVICSKVSSDKPHHRNYIVRVLEGLDMCLFFVR